LLPILACSDRAANFISSNSELLSRKYKLLSPAADLTAALNDKRCEIEKMVALGIPLPKSISRLDDSDFGDQLNVLKYPLILKPRSFAGYEIIHAKNIIFNDIDEVMAFRSDYANCLDQFVIQEVIAGTDDQLWVCNATFDKNSNLVAAFTFQRLGTMPSHYGVTSLAISRLNPQVVELVKSIGKGIGYVGPAMFEFKYDIIRNEYLYIEINPRLGMCNWFVSRCGINNPAVAAFLADDKPLLNIPTQQDGLIYWHFMGDLIARLEDRESIKNILLRVIKLIFKKKVWAMFVWSDSYPATISFFNNLKVLFSRVMKAIKR
jgi:predicted ATP-grasp superfamily ATP-dependent carboligase